MCLISLYNILECHEMDGEYLDACRIYVLLLKAYPETVALYGVI